MKQYILIPEDRGDLMWAKIPSGVRDFSVCYVVESNKLPQKINYNNRLEIGHDYQIRNNYLVSRRKEVLINAFILVQIEDEGKKCKTCRKDNQQGSFCSSCGSFLF